MLRFPRASLSWSGWALLCGWPAFEAWVIFWDSYLDLLRTSYPDWIFDSGYLSA
jgi:hypothetical protein